MNLGRIIKANNHYVLMKRLYRTQSKSRLLLVPYDWLLMVGSPDYVCLDSDSESKTLIIRPATETEIQAYNIQFPERGNKSATSSHGK